MKEDIFCLFMFAHSPHMKVSSAQESPSSFSICLSVSVGKKNKLRLYYLSWLRNKILHNDPEVEKRQGWTSVGDLEGCVHYKVGEYSF